MKILKRELLALILAIVLAVSGIGISGTVYAAEAEAFTKKAIDFTLGEAQSFVIGDSDAIIVDGAIEYRKVYKITMPAQGILNIHFDSKENSSSWGVFIYNVLDPNTQLMMVDGKPEYNNSTGSYILSSNTSLDAGEYYICIGYVYGRIAYSTTTTNPTTISMSYVKPDIRVSSISLNSAQLSLEIGSQYTLTTSVSPTNATNKDILWKSEDNSIATVNNGVVTAVGYGTTKIIASSADGGASTSCVVTVPKPDIPVSSISVSATSLSMNVGQSITVTATVNPENATQKDIVWTSSAPEVATVSNGSITAKSTGVAKITASSTDGVHNAVISVTVNGADRSKEISNITSAKPKISVVKSGKKKATIRFTKVKVGGIKYEIAYKKGKGSWTTVKTNAASKTISKLTSKKKYSFRVRGYKEVNGNVYYTKWSATKKAKIK